MRKEKSSGQQLHSLLGKLALCVDRRDELGGLVGYTILLTLANFQTTSGSEEEVQFQQVKAVYSALEQTIEKVSEQGAYDYICELELKFIPSIQNVIISNDEINKKIKPIISCIKPYLSDILKNREDILQRFGLRLINLVDQRGKIYGNKKTSLTSDYETIFDCFVRG